MTNYLLPENELHIICVDDDVDFIQSIGMFLPEKINSMNDGSNYFRFSFFTNPAEALAQIKELCELKEELAMVISDQKMPVMKGTEFIAEVKTMVPEVSCVLLTGYAGIESAVDAINNKLLDRYLTKPIDDHDDFAVSIFQMVKSYQMGRMIKNQSRTLKDLYQFSNTLNSIQDYDEALDYIVDFTMRALDCKRVSIMLIKQGPEPYLEIEASKGIEEEVVKTTKLAIGQGIAGKVFKNKEAVYVKNVSELGYAIQPHPDNAKFISVPILWANLQSGENPVGVINATHKNRDQPFTQPDLELLTYISNTATIAINNHIHVRALHDSLIEKKTQAAAQSHILSHDGISGLPNRTSFTETLYKLIGSGDSSPRTSVIILNLLRFRDINCSIGHNSGDILLKKISRKLVAALEKPQFLYHFGSDEFGIILPNSNDGKTSEIIRVIQSVFETPLEIDGLKVDTDFSFGIATFPDHATDINVLLQKADVALINAKQHSKPIYFYDEEHDRFNTRRLSMVNELRHAVENDELILHYQPQVSVATREVEGVEALVRWIHPVHGFTPPDQFIPMAEQMGLMEPLTEWVIRTAAKQASKWKGQSVFGSSFNISVNLSTLNLSEEGFAKKISDICDEAGIGTDFLNLEVTESVLMGDIDVSLKTLSELSEMGFKVDLDDFGTGYSSLAYVKRLPIDAIKVDRSFVRDITTDEQDLHIVQSIIELGHSLNLRVIAEGVENIEACGLLKDLKCDVLQGYYFSKPLPTEDLEKWMLDYKAEQF